MSDVDAFVASLDAFEPETRRVAETVEDELRRQQAQDRSRIAKLIVWLFALACGGTMLFVVVSVWWPSQGWDAGATQLVEILSSIILPVVTLVIGYYFGSEQRTPPDR